MSKEVVIKHSAAIQITNNVSLLQRRAWNLLLAEAYDKLLNDDIYEVSTKDLMKALRFKSKNFEYLKDTIEELNVIAIKWNVLNKDKEWLDEWNTIPLLAGTKVGREKIKYSFSPLIRQELHNPRFYARINLSLQNNFSSKHAIAIYELCIDYYSEKARYGETPLIDIKKFRELMAIKDHQYKTFSDLKKRIIDNPINEIESKSNVRINVKYKKTGRKFAYLKFIITKINYESTGNGNDIVMQVVDYVLPKNQAEKLIDEYGEERVKRNLDYTKNYKNIGNKKAFFINAVKEDYGYKPNSEIKEEKSDILKNTYKTISDERDKLKEEIKRAYDKHVSKQCIKYMETLPEEEIEPLKKRFKRERAFLFRGGNGDFDKPHIKSTFARYLYSQGDKQEPTEGEFVQGGRYKAKVDDLNKRWKEAKEQELELKGTNEIFS